MNTVSFDEIKISDKDQLKLLQLIIENQLNFWASCKSDYGDFPHELFDENQMPHNMMREGKGLFNILREVGINTYNLEKIV